MRFYRPHSWNQRIALASFSRSLLDFGNKWQCLNGYMTAGRQLDQSEGETFVGLREKTTPDAAFALSCRACVDAAETLDDVRPGRSK